MIDHAVADFLESLPPQVRQRVVLPFDSDERFNWHYVPKPRRGLSLKDMGDDQRRAAMAILRAALSDKGYRRCEDIMRLEPIVAEIEGDHETYHPLAFAFTVFGKPGGAAPWGWRIDGHHLSLNFVHGPEGVSAVPVFYGAHPATVEHGELKGLRVLGAEEWLGRELMRALEPAAFEAALISAQPFRDIVTGPGREQILQRPAGLPVGRMSEAQRNLAIRLIEEFIGTLTPTVAESERLRLRTAGLDDVHFAWAGSVEPRRPHYWRLHGPTLLIEYDNTQNDANHIHSVWHHPEGDFGTDILRRHYESGHHR